jgi:hypothetical protein
MELFLRHLHDLLLLLLVLATAAAAAAAVVVTVAEEMPPNDVETPQIDEPAPTPH